METKEFVFVCLLLLATLFIGLGIGLMAEQSIEKGALSVVSAIFFIMSLSCYGILSKHGKEVRSLGQVRK